MFLAGAGDDPEEALGEALAELGLADVSSGYILTSSG